MNIKLLLVNLLTIIRVIGTIVLIPIYNIYGGKIVAIVSLICYLTDSIDGILARKWKVSTFFGALFDGIADKLFTIINFIILFLITPYALIPVIIEILIVILQLIKFNRNLNVQSNIIGKIKVWILAITIVLTFLISDINNIDILSLNIKEFFINIDSKILYLYLLLPVILMDIFTLISYIYELCTNKSNVKINNQKKVSKVKLTKIDRINYLKNVWFSPKFYEEHKDDTNLKDLRKLSRKVR